MARSSPVRGLFGQRARRRVQAIALSIVAALSATGIAAAESAPVLPPCGPAFPAPASAEQNAQLVALGQLLFYDPILSGNREVACATCHHSSLSTSDGVSLGIGDGGAGLGAARVSGTANRPEQRIPRNSPALFNLGYAEFSTMFHDGRVEKLGEGRVRTPLGENAVDPNLPMLAIQAMFPVLSPDEMAGHYAENEIAQAVRRGMIAGQDGAWALLAARVSAIPAYRDAFATVSGQPGQIRFTDIAQALAAFIAVEWRADDSPFDRLICHGEELAPQAEAGLRLFYGKAGCSNCHAGRFQTDHGFHAIAMPQIGPGKAETSETHARDTGRMRVTGNAREAFRFRTPSLRNVAQTAPYGHAGAYTGLEDVVRHHLAPISALKGYDRAQATLPQFDGADDFRVLDDPVQVAEIAAANELDPNALSDAEVAALLAFLHALTDQDSLRGQLGVPENVPSGLPVPGR